MRSSAIPNVRCVLLLAFCGFALLAAGCKTTPVSYDFSQPGWNVQRGQAVWKSSRNADEIAGELLVAANPNGRAMVEFSKPPLTFVTVILRNGHWTISSPLRGKFSGPGEPPTSVLWAQLPHLITDGKLSPRWKVTRDGAENFSITNESTGEVLTGFLAP